MLDLKKERCSSCCSHFGIMYGLHWPICLVGKAMVGDMTSFCSLGGLEVVGEEGVDSASITACHSFNGKRNGN